jgi:hypothetical protein
LFIIYIKKNLRGKDKIYKLKNTGFGRSKQRKNKENIVQQLKNP